MKTLAWFVTASAMCAVTLAQADDAKSPPLKCNIDSLNKAWNLKLKSVSVKETKQNDSVVSEISVTLEFSKDVSEAEAKEIYKAFLPANYFRGLKTAPVRNLIVSFHLFDEENVQVQQVPIERLEGSISGKAGDAFRVVVVTHPDALKKIKKVEPRPFSPPR